MNTNINIFNSNIYKKDISKDDLSILLKEYWLIIKYYLKFLIENIKIKDKKEHFYFIFKRGLIHKNIYLMYYVCIQKILH